MTRPRALERTYIDFNIKQRKASGDVAEWRFEKMADGETREGSILGEFFRKDDLDEEVGE